MTIICTKIQDKSVTKNVKCYLTNVLSADTCNVDGC